MSMAELALRDPEDARPGSSAPAICFSTTSDGAAPGSRSSRSRPKPLSSARRLDATRPKPSPGSRSPGLWLNDPANNIAGGGGVHGAPDAGARDRLRQRGESGARPIQPARARLDGAPRPRRDALAGCATGPGRVDDALAGRGRPRACCWPAGRCPSSPARFPFPMPLDHRVALFTIVIAVLTAVTFSLGPALGVTITRDEEAAPASSAAGGSGASRARFALVALQAALSLGLLATGAQFTKTVQASATQEHIPDPESAGAHVVRSGSASPRARSRRGFLPPAARSRRARSPAWLPPGSRPRGLVFGTSQGDSLAQVWLPDSPPEGLRLRAFHVSPGLARRRRGTGCFRAADSLRGPDRLCGPSSSTSRSSPSSCRGRRWDEPSDSARRAWRAQCGGTEVTVVGVVDGMLKRGDLEPPLVSLSRRRWPISRTRRSTSAWIATGAFNRGRAAGGRARG